MIVAAVVLMLYAATSGGNSFISEDSILKPVVRFGEKGAFSIAVAVFSPPGLILEIVLKSWEHRVAIQDYLQVRWSKLVAMVEQWVEAVGVALWILYCGVTNVCHALFYSLVVPLVKIPVDVMFRLFYALLVVLNWIFMAATIVIAAMWTAVEGILSTLWSLLFEPLSKLLLAIDSMLQV
jgi:hypothetical protein